MPPKRRDKGHYGSKYNRMRSEVLASEKVCYLCGEWVDQTLDWRDDGAPQIHMVIPLTRGGSWRDRNNLHLTHRICNIRQGNKLEGEVAHSLREQVGAWVVGETP